MRHGKPIQVGRVRTNKRGSWGKNGEITPPNTRPINEDSTTNRSPRERESLFYFLSFTI